MEPTKTRTDRGAPGAPPTPDWPSQTSYWLGLRKEPTKRKSESRPGIHSKKPKIDIESVNESQERLKSKRKKIS